ncbi:unnamed protein product [Lampetra fluviatilis]
MTTPEDGGEAPPTELHAVRPYNGSPPLGRVLRAEHSHLAELLHAVGIQRWRRETWSRAERQSLPKFPRFPPKLPHFPPKRAANREPPRFLPKIPANQEPLRHSPCIRPPSCCGAEWSSRQNRSCTAIACAHSISSTPPARFQIIFSRGRAEVEEGTAWHDGTTSIAEGGHHLVRGVSAPGASTAACRDTSQRVALRHDGASPDHRRHPSADWPLVGAGP